MYLCWRFYYISAWQLWATVMQCVVCEIITGTHMWSQVLASRPSTQARRAILGLDLKGVIIGILLASEEKRLEVSLQSKI